MENIEEFYAVGFYWDEANPQNQLPRFFEKGIWENGFENEYLEAVKSVRVGAKLAAKTCYVRKEGVKSVSVLEVHSIGTVVGNPGDGRKLKVNWQKDFYPLKIDGSGGYRSTISKIKKQSLINLIFREGSEQEEINTVKDKKSMMPFNQILFGPPGTGKTYKLSKEYFPKFTDEKQLKSKEEFAEELVGGLAWWEVISVVMLDLKEAKVQEIFAHPLLQAKNGISQNKTPKNTIWAWLQRHTKEECKTVNIAKRDQPLFFEKSVDGIWSIDREMAKKETPELLEVLKNYQEYSPQSKTERRYVFTTFHQSFSYEDFVEGIKPVLSGEESEEGLGYAIEPGVFMKIAEEARKNKDKDYAIFIDEINRGNIAGIFGELITLIEPDKREGMPNEISVTLPYSKRKFTVPANLYIIGTMNTADRSIEALDTALRRRFTFEEMPPLPEKLPVIDEVNLKALLECINKRIEKLIDKDHCIGHAYFMCLYEVEDPAQELEVIFYNKIIPLLQEYFFGDYGKIQLVIGKDFFEKPEPVTSNFFADSDYEDQDMLLERKVYRIKRLEGQEFLKAVKKIYPHEETNQDIRTPEATFEQ